MTSLKMVMSESYEAGLRASLSYFALDLLKNLKISGILTGSVEEVYASLNLSSLTLDASRSTSSLTSLKARTAKCSVILPFCGKIVDDWCLAVRYNHGLYTQCSNGRVSDGDYCATCFRQAENSSTGKPPHGDIRERAEAGSDYRSAKGKQCIPFANVAEKLGLDVEKAKLVAETEFGWSIPEWELEKRKSKRGRPAKSAAVSDTDSEPVAAAKKRGRPKKQVSGKLSQVDLIAKLVSEAGVEILGDGESDKASVSSAASVSSESSATSESSAASLANQSASEAAEKGKSVV